MRVLVLTVVHHPEDARILHRQIRALVDAGHSVRYAAPFSAYDARPPSDVAPVDLPRAVGRRRLRALRAARRCVRRYGRDADVVLLHDPELLLAVASLPRPPSGLPRPRTGLPRPPSGLPRPRARVPRPPIVWDVHEDTAAALSLKPWLPGWLRGPAAWAVTTLERLAERRVHLLLAEESYLARFQRPHPVVPNTTYVPSQVPAPGTDRVIYVGHLSAKRGARDMVLLGRELRSRTDGAVAVHLIGHADPATTGLLEAAQAAGDVRWHGFQPNDKALAFVEGALAGVSLLHDEPNYRHSRPTKVIEYMGRGVPVVTTPAPPARALVEEAGSGIAVRFGPPERVAVEAASAVLRLRADAALRERFAEAGRTAAFERFSWAAHAPAFVAELERIARTR